MAPVSSKEFLDIQTNIECGFTLKRVRDMIKTSSQITHRDEIEIDIKVVWNVLPNIVRKNNLILPVTR